MIANPRQIYDRIRAAGYSHAQACGILGNMEQESGFRVSVEGFDGTGSYGLCQWLGSRKAGLRAFAKERGKPMSDPLVQVDWMLKELNTTERLAAGKLRACSTHASAALAFSRYYERPHKDYAHNDKRMKYAAHWAQEFGNAG